MAIYAISKLDRVTVILPNDSAISRPKNFGAYRDSRDESLLGLTEEPTRFIVRPLSAAEERSINVAAIRNNAGDINAAGVEIRSETVRLGLLEVSGLMQDGKPLGTLSGAAAIELLPLSVVMAVGAEISELGIPSKKLGEDEGKSL